MSKQMNEDLDLPTWGEMYSFSEMYKTWILWDILFKKLTGKQKKVSSVTSDPNDNASPYILLGLLKKIMWNSIM